MPETKPGSSDNRLKTQYSVYQDLLKSVVPSGVAPEVLEDAWNAAIEDRHVLVSEDDLRRFGAPPRYLLSSAAARALQNESNGILSDMTAILNSEGGGADRIGDTRALPLNVHNLQERVQASERDLERQMQCISGLVKETHKEQEKLQHNLETALRTLPPILDRACSATNELAATEIEASLIKLSLIRAETEQTLYKQRSVKTPDNPTTVAKAVVTAFKKLRAQEQDLLKEDRSLGQQLQEYESLIKIVDGGAAGGYQQIVEDWVCVQRDTEDCKRDLRRLGWTGD